MKYYKITLNKGSGGVLLYPENYQAEVGDKAVDHLYYDENDQAYLLLLIPDKVENIVRAGVEEIAEADAKAISSANEARVELVKDEVKLRRLELKAKLGQVLSQAEMNAVDVSHPDSIFSVYKTLGDRIDERNDKALTAETPVIQ